MERPITSVDRDASLGRWEVSIGIDGSQHDSIQVFFYDDGRTEVERFTPGQLMDGLTMAIYDAATRASSVFERKA